MKREIVISTCMLVSFLQGMEEHHVEYIRNPKIEGSNDNSVKKTEKSADQRFLELYSISQASHLQMYLDNIQSMLTAGHTIYLENKALTLHKDECTRIQQYHDFLLKNCKSILKHAKKTFIPTEYEPIVQKITIIVNVIKSLPDFLQPQKKKLFTLKR